MMPRGATWEKLEERMKDLLQLDKAKRTPLSGGTKGEEDVVGVGTICQCKDSDNKNITILTKDIERLLQSAKLLNKTPIFASRAGEHTLVSFPLDEEYIDDIIYVLNQLILISRLRVLTDHLKHFEGAKFVDAMCTEFDRAVRLSTTVTNMLRERIDALKNKLEAKVNNATMFNLFGDENATE